VMPALLDRYLAKTGYSSQQTDQRVGADRPNNLWEPLDGSSGSDHGAHGDFDDRALGHSPQLWLAEHSRTLSLVAAAGAALTGGGIAWTRNRQ
jgi:hypothetical protein